LKYQIISSDFSKIFKLAQSFLVHDVLFKYTIKKGCGIGFAVSTKYGSAVQRNLFKRRCRFLYRKIFVNQKRVASIIVKPKTKNISFSSLNESFKILYDKIYN